MTDDELRAIERVKQLDDADILTKNDLTTFIDIMERYMPGVSGVICENHDPDIDLSQDQWEN